MGMSTTHRAHDDQLHRSDNSIELTASTILLSLLVPLYAVSGDSWRYLYQTPPKFPRQLMCNQRRCEAVPRA